MQLSDAQKWINFFTDEALGKIRNFLTVPVIIVIGANYLFPERLDSLRTLLPYPLWIEKTFQVVDTILYLWNRAGYIILAANVFLWVLKFLVFRHHHTNFLTKKSTRISLGYVVESSIWWWILSGIQLLYHPNIPLFWEAANIDPLLSYPALIFASFYLFSWLDE